MIARPIAALALLGAPLLMAASPPAAEEMGSNWAAGWFSAPFAPIAGQPGGTPAIFANQTVRQILRVDATGSAIRLKLTNELGIAPVRIAGVHVALVDAEGRLVPGSDRVVTLPAARKPGCPPARRCSAMPYRCRSRRCNTWRSRSITRTARCPPRIMPIWWWRPVINWPPRPWPAPAAARPGGGVASGSGAAPARPGDRGVRGFDHRRRRLHPGKDMSWPQQFAKRLAADPRYRGWSVVNAGMSGNRLLHEGFGLPALARLDRDALAVSGVTHIVLLEGINDIGWWNKPDSDVTAERVIEAYRQIVARAHARGVKVIGATILPYKGAVYFTPEGEAMRQAVNAFIRTGGLFDGVIDFEKAAADPADPARIDPRLEPGDHLHPNDAGYAALAAAVSPSLFEAPRR
jgi:lysophospholipase L1-like esterase